MRYEISTGDLALTYRGLTLRKRRRLREITLLLCDMAVALSHAGQIDDAVEAWVEYIPDSPEGL